LVEDEGNRIVFVRPQAFRSTLGNRCVWTRKARCQQDKLTNQSAPLHAHDPAFSLLAAIRRAHALNEVDFAGHPRRLSDG
jgi:hypothetical protein